MKPAICFPMANAGNYDTRSLEFLDRGSYWGDYLRGSVIPLVEKYNPAAVMFHLPAGRNDIFPMDFDGFTEVEKGYNENPRLRPARYGFYWAAVGELALKFPALEIWSYTGSMLADPDIANAPTLSAWLHRARAETSRYRDLPIHPDKNILALDYFTAVDKVGDTLAQDKHREFVAECIHRGMRIALEPHPFPEHLDSFTPYQTDGFVARASHWFSAWKKYPTRDALAERKIPAALLCYNQTELDKAAQDTAPGYAFAIAWMLQTDLVTFPKVFA